MTDAILFGTIGVIAVLTFIIVPIELKFLMGMIVFYIFLAIVRGTPI